MTVPIWKIWELERIDEPEKKVDKRRLQQTRQKKYKATRITNKLKVTGCTKSTSRVTEHVEGKTIYQSVRQAKLASKKMTVPIWKIWEPERIDEPDKK